MRWGFAQAAVHIVDGATRLPLPEEAAVRLGVSESAFKSMIHRLRKRHGELVREEIAHTVPTAAEIDEELRYLVAVLRGRSL